MQILHDEHNAKAIALRAQLEERLDPEALPANLCLCLGGDGFLLRQIRTHGEGPTYLGLNCGRLGFMLNDWGDLDTLVEQLGRPQCWSRLSVRRLRGRWTDPDFGDREAVALNDIYLERASGQTAHLRVSIDGNRVVERLVCDGLLVCTALGSTAYALAAGGAACHLSLPLMQMVAINPHIPRLPPINLPPSSRVEVEVLDGHRRPVRLVADGQDHPDVSRVTIRDAGSPVTLAWLEGHDPTGTLVRKLLHP